MDTLVHEHTEIVIWLFGGLIGLVSWLAKREFNGIQRHQDRQDARLDKMSEKLVCLESDTAAARVDRSGLHAEISSAFKALQQQLAAFADSNQRAHEDIKLLIRRNGNGGK